MRRVGILIAVLLLAPGCFVFDELDKGQKLMEQHSPKTDAQRKAASQAAEAPAKPEKPQPGLLDQVRDWIAQRTAEAEPKRPQADPDDVPVSCRIGGHVQFVRKSDCQLRGGRVI